MKNPKKFTILGSVLISLSLVMTACGGNTTSSSSPSSSSNPSSTTAQPQETEAPATEAPATPAAKIKMTLMTAAADDKVAQAEQKMVADHFADKYDITFKPWDANAEKNIKTTIAANNPIDLAMYWPNQMETFVNANMALDLTPYLDENNGEWRNTFLDNVLDSGKYNDKIYAIPYAAVYPLLEVNKDILVKAGVTIPDGPFSWDDFMKACASIKEKTGVWPIGINKDWSAWVSRNNLITAWPDKTALENFVAGKTSFTDPTVVKAFDATKELYDKYVYSGKGAISTTLDEINIAFKAGKIAMRADVNILAAKAVKDSGLQNIQIVSWPYMGTSSQVLGGSNGYMIPANAAHPKDSIEIMKYLTSVEVLQARVDTGAPVTIKGVKSDDPNFAVYSKDTANIQPKEILSLSSEITDVMNNKMPANYLFTGKSSLDELDKLRLKAINNK